MQTAGTIELGPARISLLNLGEIQADLAVWLALPPAAWGAHAPLFEHPHALPVQSALIELPSMAVLVDACDPAVLARLDPPPPGIALPPDLFTQLAQLGVRPEAIGHVLITHLHDDHYIGLAREHGGALAPCFPQARHYIGRADWQAAQARIAAPAVPADHVLATLAQHGLVEPVDARLELSPELMVLATPGETPGHLALRLRAGEQCFYALGDLYHHEVEVARPDWLVHWADPASTRASREGIVAAALAEEALLMATHMRGLGRLRAAAGGLRWEEI